MPWDFSSHLARHGPGGAGPAPSLPRARAYCRRLATSHYENFPVASLLLPRRLLRHFHAIYAYCRWADDLADETGDRAGPLLAWWRDQLEACYHGEASHPVFVALAETIHAFAIPRRPFLDLLLAFEQDQHVRRYDTFAQLLDYCRHSANPVGRLVLYLFHCHDETRSALSDHLCTGLQLANCWQDIARDLALGRVYLPREDRERFGCSEEDLRACRFTPEFASLMRFEVERTRELFGRGRALVPLVPSEARAEVELFVRGGLAILDKIEGAGFDVLGARPALTRWDKGKLLASALWGRLRDRLGMG